MSDVIDIDSRRPAEESVEEMLSDPVMRQSILLSGLIANIDDMLGSEMSIVILARYLGELCKRRCIDEEKREELYTLVNSIMKGNDTDVLS